MTREETEEYVSHRLETVGWQGSPAFTPGAFDKIHAQCGGVPRLINTLGNRIMLFASLEEAVEIDGAMVQTVIEDQKSETIQAGAPAPAAPAAAAAPSAGAAAIPADRFGKVERAVAVLVKRLERLEERVTEHDDAIHELIDLAMNSFGNEEPNEELRSA